MVNSHTPVETAVWKHSPANAQKQLTGARNNISIFSLSVVATQPTAWETAVKVHCRSTWSLSGAYSPPQLEKSASSFPAWNFCLTQRLQQL